MQNLSLFESDSQPSTVDNHLSFNFNNHTNFSLTTFRSLTETKSYTPITGCVLEHIITTTNLTNCEKLYYLLADSLALISKNKGYDRSCALPSEDWAIRLRCSRSLVFTMQRSLVKKGYFIISKDWDKISRNKRNLITPTLPTSIFNHLNEKFSGRVGEHTPYNPFNECKRSYLDRTKLFIKLNYDLLKIITSNEYLNPRGKMMWLGFYTRCYKNYMLVAQEDFNVDKYSYNDDSSFSFITSYRELADMYSCHTKHLSKSIRALEELGFIKTENIYIRKRCSDNDGNIIQERQDRSLWKITLSLPDDCIAELKKVKDRSNLKLKDIQDRLVAIDNTIDPKLIEDCLILGGIKFNLNLEQSSLLKSLIDGDINDNGSDINYNGNIAPIPPLLHVPYTESYIDSVMEELDAGDVKNIKNKLEKSSELEDIDLLSNTLKTLSTSSSWESLDDKEEKNNGIKFDPHIAKSGLLLNKDFLLKIKDIKSNLGLTPKVLFNNFLKRFKKDDSEICKGNNQKQKLAPEFNICSELIRKKLKELPKDKADKARKFAYSIVAKKLATGYAAGLSKHELAKQLIHHAATWKPTKLGNISREKEIDTALAVAWKSIVKGTWQPPLEFAKAEILNYEYQYYCKKYRESGVLSHELKALESDVNKVLGEWCDLGGRIIKESQDIDGQGSRVVILPASNLKPNILNNTTNEGILFTMSDEIMMNDYRHLEDFPEVQLFNNYNIDLSTLSDEQKYLRISGSDTDLIEINTINHRQYFGKLKTLEINEDGDLVMIMKPSDNQSFASLSIDNDFRPQALDSDITKNLDWNNINRNYKNDLQEAYIEPRSYNDDKLKSNLADKGTIKIDSIIGNIMKSLKQQE